MLNMTKCHFLIVFKHFKSNSIFLEKFILSWKSSTEMFVNYPCGSWT